MGDCVHGETKRGHKPSPKEPVYGKALGIWKVGEIAFDVFRSLSDTVRY